MDKQQRIREKFEKGEYRVENVPRYMEASWEGTYVLKDGYKEREPQEDLAKWSREKVEWRKLKIEGYGDFGLEIRLVRMEYFETRERMEEMHEECEFGFGVEDQNPEEEQDRKEKVTLEEVLELFPVHIKWNKKYYLGNVGEQEVEQGEEKKKELRKIFGESEEDGEGGITLTEVRVLAEDGNSTCVTAKRGGYYWLIYYSTS